MTNNGVISERTPLSVLLFHAAIERQQSLSDFADDLDVGAISLRQFILGKTQRPRQKTLETIAEALGISVEDVRRRMSLLPEATPGFGQWLDEQMKSRGKLSRAKLTRDTRISDGALRNYLSGQTLPDADQAKRLADVLEVSTLEMARVIVANEVLQKGGELAPPAEAGADGAEAQGEEGSGEMASFLSLPAANGLAGSNGASYDEGQLLSLWRQLHPQARRATLGYIAMLLAEG